MAKRFNKEKLRAFLLRRKLNTYGLLVITTISALITLFCAMQGISSSKLDLMVMVTIALIILCFLQAFKMRKNFRTIRSFKGFRKKKKDPAYDDAH